jgi:hypothetical protein
LTQKLWPAAAEQAIATGYALYRIGDLYGALEDLSHAIGLYGEQACHISGAV